MPLWCTALEWLTLLQVSGVRSPHTPASLRVLPAGWTALQNQLKWMLELFHQKAASDKEAPTDAKCGVGCKICTLALGVKKEETGESCTGLISYPQPRSLATLQAHWGRRSSYSCWLALGQSEDNLAIRLAQHNLSQPLPKA